MTNTNQPKTLKVNSTADLLASLLQLLGYQPKNSIVVLPMQDKRISGAARLDIPVEEFHEIKKTVEAIITTAQVTEKIVIVCYTDSKLPHIFCEENQTLETKLLKLTRSIAEDENINLHKAILVGDNGWLEMHGDSAELRPLQEIHMSSFYPKEDLKTVEEWRANNGQNNPSTFSSVEELRENLQKTFR